MRIIKFIIMLIKRLIMGRQSNLETIVEMTSVTTQFDLGANANEFVTDTGDNPLGRISFFLPYIQGDIGDDYNYGILLDMRGSLQIFGSHDKVYITEDEIIAEYKEGAGAPTLDRQNIGKTVFMRQIING